MDRDTASKKLEECLHSIFAWSLSKLHDNYDAEDLTSDIVYAVLSSVDRLQKDEAFYGFLWRTAENILRSRLRKMQTFHYDYEENYHGAYWNTPESEILKSEQLHLLRRELSIMSRQYREVTVSHYIHGKSCAEISTELNISVEMVKYYLFKTRKKLKEGIDMIREFGERSYAPGTFRMDFWGMGDNSIYWQIFNRKLPGNILLSAYHKPMTISELSVELGVASPYLEDELEILVEHDIIQRCGDKYQTNIVIFTDEYEKHVLSTFKPVYAEAAANFTTALNNSMSELKNVQINGNKYDDNRLKWTYANIALYHALRKFDIQGREKLGDYPLLSNGGNGFIYGYDNDYINNRFNGLYGYYENDEKTAWVTIENYRAIEKCQHFQVYKWEDTMSALTDAALCKAPNESNAQLIRLIDEGFISSCDGKLSANFPVFEEDIFEGSLKTLLSPMITIAVECMEQLCDIAAKTIVEYIPRHLKTKGTQLTRIRYQMDTMAFIIESMIENGALLIPNEQVGLCMFGVTMRQQSSL